VSSISVNIARLTRGHAHTVQRGGDVLIRPPARHALDNGEGFFGSAATMLAGFWLAYPQLGMLAAAPMNRENDLTRRVVDIGNDVGDECAQEPLHASINSGLSTTARLP
jgi:hypothetical protein